MKKVLIYSVLVIAGAIAGVLGYGLLGPESDRQAGEGEKEPLYWVAPMDPSYKRDQPGKSPMGMDLVPVYPGDEKGGNDSPGTVRISPDVVNNLGVRTAEVKRDALNAEIDTVGYVQFDEDRLVHVHPRVAGWIEKLYVKAEGDPVDKGQPLYEIYSPDLVNAQEELVLALNRSNARLIEAAEDRLRALQVPASAIQRLRETREVRQTLTLHAPQGGVVDNLNVREGFYVQPATRLMTIGALDEVWVVGQVFERQASLVREGDPVTMTLDYLPDQVWRGNVDYVYPTLNNETRTARVRLRFSNPLQQLKPNMFARLEIHSQAAENAVVIPREALIRTGDQNRVVLALGEGRFKSIAVKTGRMVDDRVEVVDGLRPGERIVTSAQFLLDSESSKTSDFRRMNHDQKDTGRPDRVWVEATINGLDTDQRVLNATHKPIPAWGWPVMTMDFPAAESLDLTALEPGMTVHLQLRDLGEEDYRVEQVHTNGAGGHKPSAGEGAGDISRGNGGAAHSPTNHQQQEGAGHD